MQPSQSTAGSSRSLDPVSTATLYCWAGDPTLTCVAVAEVAVAVTVAVLVMMTVAV